MNPLRTDYKYAHISTATTTQVLTGNCSLVRIVINTTSAGAITVYDNIAGATTNIVGVIKASAPEQSLEYGVKLGQGLQVVTAGASDITVVYTQN